jgi:Outer membrane lipoprotein carrier protein LolA-like
MKPRAYFNVCCITLVLGALAPCRAAPPVEGTIRLLEGQILRGRFEQERQLEGFQTPFKSTGTFLLVPGRGLVWRAEVPFAVTTVISPAGLMQEIRGRETMRMPATKLPFMAKLYAMLSGTMTGDWSALESTFNVVHTREAKGWSLQLTPLKADDPNLPIHSIRARGGRLLEQIELVKPHGDRDRLVFLDQRIETAKPAAQEAALLEAANQQ